MVRQRNGTGGGIFTTTFCSAFLCVASCATNISLRAFVSTCGQVMTYLPVVSPIITRAAVLLVLQILKNAAVHGNVERI